MYWLYAIIATAIVVFSAFLAFHQSPEFATYRKAKGENYQQHDAHPWHLDEPQRMANVSKISKIARGLTPRGIADVSARNVDSCQTMSGTATRRKARGRTGKAPGRQQDKRRRRNTGNTTPSVPSTTASQPMMLK